MLSTELSERQLLDALPISIFAVDLDGQVTRVHQTNSRFDEATSATTPIEEQRAHGVVSALRGPVSRDHIAHAMHVLRTGRAPLVRWEAVDSGDDQHVYLAQMTAVHDDSHAVTGFVVSTVDITPLDREREAAVDSGVALALAQDLPHACQEAAHQLRRVLRADTVVIALIADDGTSPRIAYDYGSDVDRLTLEQRFAAVWQSAVSASKHVVTPDEGTGSITATVGDTDRLLGVITVVADQLASPERFAEARRFLTSVSTQLAAAIDRAAHVSNAARRQRGAAIGEVAAGVAHELRNPIFGISSAAQLLRFRAREDPVMEQNVGRILREVERLNRMVATLLELGRPIALKRSPADPDVVWDDVLESERGRLESRAIAVRRTRPSEPTLMPIDGEQLAQAFKSILSNAVEAAPEASDLVLHSVTLPNGSWRCRLTNGGAPIPADMLPRVFEPFLSTKPGNTGVGLALAQRIVEEHLGAITIESAADTGTTACVILPTTRTPSVP